MALIFVVEDEPILLDLIATFLRLGGDEVKANRGPIAAYEAIIAARTPVDLLLIEADLKPISGFQLVNRLRGKRINCPVIFMSSHHGVAAILTESLGRRAVIEKPFTATELRTAVRASLAAE